MPHHLGGPMRTTRKRRLQLEDILAWATRYRESTGQWPSKTTGEIPGTFGVTWPAVDGALREGTRGLPGGSSLAQLLADKFGARNIQSLSSLSEPPGRWPTAASGPISEAPGDSWHTIDEALRHGWRGLRGGSSLACLLDRYGKRRNPAALPRLSYKKILSWADAHFRCSGAWPNINSGPVADAPGERWDLIDNALRAGCRGLPGGSSLHRLLTRKRGHGTPAPPEG
jgi:hypothetical protein